jgi:hypothetical protein
MTASAMPIGDIWFGAGWKAWERAFRKARFVLGGVGGAAALPPRPPWLTL